MAWRPISGRAPAPRPRVSFFPIWTLMSDLEAPSAWESVFTEMKSTPCSRSSIMRLTALPPPPPTPTTFIRALWTAPSSSSNRISEPSLWGPGRTRPDCSEEVLQPPFHRTKHLFHRGTAARAAERAPERDLPRAVEHQSGRHRHPRTFHAVHQSRESGSRGAEPDGEREHLPRELDYTGELAPPSSQDHAGREMLLISGPR